MPKNRKQKILFALMTVIITVHAYVFYSLYVVNGQTLMSINGTSTVIGAINKQGGVYMFGNMLPIWAVVLVEFGFAMSLELLLGQPFSFKIASKHFDIKKTNPALFEAVIICVTVFIMCPSMSLIASFLYYPYYNGFNFISLMASWIKLICINFPFAFFSQLFFIQPLVRCLFKLVVRQK